MPSASNEAARAARTPPRCPPPLARRIGLGLLVAWASSQGARADEVHGGGSASTEALARAELAGRCARGPLVQLDEAPRSDCASMRVEARTIADAAIAATVLDATLDGQLWSVLAVRAGERTVVGTVAVGWSPGVGAHSAEGATEVSFEDVLPGGASELVVRFHGIAADSDAEPCVRRSLEVARTVVCSTDSGTLACATLPDAVRRARTSCDDGSPPLARARVDAARVRAAFARRARAFTARARPYRLLLP